MPVTTIDGHEIHVDDEGFMTVYEEWDETLAKSLATAIGIDMAEPRGIGRPGSSRFQ